MNDARCDHPNAEPVYSIYQFQRLTAIEIEKYRHRLFCVDCGAEAFYRRKSISGNAACFGSNYHTSECDAAAPSAKDKKIVKHAIEVDQIVADSEEVLFDFEFSEPKPNSSSEQKTTRVSSKGSTGASGKKHTKTSTQVRQSVLGMEKALHSLLSGSNLATSDVKIKINEKVSYRAKNLFVNFADAVPLEDSKAFKPKMFWRTISHADKDFDWLNPICKDTGVIISPFKDELLKSFKIKEHRDLDGAGLMLFGNCYWNKDKTRKIIKVHEMKIFISKADD
ncbi:MULTISPECIES: hypothetical protein [Vibrio]|uniref:hypothetical protein n=1 Tax=Vibrio TaxID=662 RepID=UPI0010BD7F29|nr:hypothetical protein [Vibrio sp. F12]TKE83083.1 hypothetical protein FCV54_11265 [Vibrio sp. F12]